MSLPWRETPPDRHEAQSHQSYGARLRYLLDTDLAYTGYGDLCVEIAAVALVEQGAVLDAQPAAERRGLSR